jgi:hypothetical protein
MEWNLRVPAISMNPELATRDDIARMAAELMEANRIIQQIRESITALNIYLSKEK